METLTGKLAKFIVGLKYQRLPGEVILKAKHCLMDTLGAALAGSRTPEALIAKRLAEKLNPRRESTLFTGKGRVGVLEAAMANGIMAHALELDDGNRYAQGRPGVATIPAVLALAEKEKLRGKDVIPAIVAGYELGLIHGRHGHQIAQHDAILLIHLAQIAAVEGIGKIAPCPRVGMSALLDERHRIHIGKAHVA